jgi:O-antigen/teichoic acid export membrane protein
VTAGWRTLASLAGATGVSQAAVVIASPILTRLYVPADFGAYGAAVSVVAVVAVVACLRYEQAIPLPDSSETAASLIVLCLGLATGTTVLTGIVLALEGDRLAAALGTPAIGSLFVPMVMALLGGSLYMTMASWAVRVAAFSDLARTRVTQAGGLVALQLGFGIVRAGAAGLVLGDAVGRSAGTWRLARIFWRSEAGTVRRVGVRSIRAAAVRYRRFPLLSAPSAVLDIVAIQAPTLILLALFGTTVTGWFVLASRVATFPNALAAASVGPVFLAESARQRREEPAALRATFKAAVKRLVLLGIGPTLLLAVGCPLLFPTVFGQTWADAGLYAAILAPMFFAQLVTSPVSGILTVLERQDLHLARELGSIAVLAIAVAVSVGGQLGAIQVVAVLSAAGTVNALVYLGVMWLAVTRI